MATPAGQSEARVEGYGPKDLPEGSFEMRRKLYWNRNLAQFARSARAWGEPRARINADIGENWLAGPYIGWTAEPCGETDAARRAPQIVFNPDAS